MGNARPLCIYHANCADGFSAAWAVRKAFNGNVDFEPGFYNRPPPDVTGRDVIIVDFSYRRPVLEGMMALAPRLIVLDHHETARHNLEFLDNAADVDPNDIGTACATFDMERSGSMITWDHFFPNQDPPALMKHVQDRDLWKFELPGTREIQAWMFSFPYDFGKYDIMMEMREDELQEVAVVEGRAILRKHDKDIAEMLEVQKGMRMVIGGYDVPVANLSYIFASDAAHTLAGQLEPFGACYFDKAAGRVFSLRSAAHGVDVQRVAQSYPGGGGHIHAAGFEVPHGHPLTLPAAPEAIQLLKRTRDGVGGS